MLEHTFFAVNTGLITYRRSFIRRMGTCLFSGVPEGDLVEGWGITISKCRCTTILMHSVFITSIEKSVLEASRVCEH